ncbi:DNA alkylation repair protein [Arenibacter sp. BSSL-BM3]|uniref:DNA alkylation repair protein n=1 Tax=Arenibacter arenosicollis TaxID=2762274 RepID=A0ABR7QQ36_9FLAO|nr:DNA alkylation repair protein [Arenibacter arenosicollis]MBC8769308.1 DNA alkylation repair protein [Arenibacter arenosicollis]
MDKSEVINLLEANQNERGIQNWKKLNSHADSLKSFGIGLTVLRKLSKKIGRDHSLAHQLWKSDIYDAKIIALLIDDPKQITRDQVELQVDNLKHGYLAHVFSSCDATLAKTPFVVDLLEDWLNSNDTMRKQCGYGLLYEVSKSKKKDAPDNAFFLQKIQKIHDTYDKEKNIILLSMGGALLGIGKRNTILNVAALKVAKKIGPIPVDSGISKCEPFDVVKHLTSDYLKKKLGI